MNYGRNLIWSPCNRKVALAPLLRAVPPRDQRPNDHAEPAYCSEFRGNVSRLFMFDWFKKKPAAPNGPDFSDINSEEEAEARLHSGELEKLFLLPPEFGGIDDPR